MNDRAISQIVSAIFLLIVTVSAATAFYTWFSGLQDRTQEMSEEKAETNFAKHISTISISAMPEIIIFDRDFDGDGYISYGELGDERLIQEISVVVTNDGMVCLNNVYLRILSVIPTNGSVSWLAVNIDPDNNNALLNKSGKEFQYENGSVYFNGEDRFDSSSKIVMSYLSSTGVEYFATNGTVPINTSNLLERQYDLHKPTYNIGN